MTRKTFTSTKASAIGPYSHATEAAGLVFLSGQIPLNPATSKIIEGGISAQTQQCFDNLFAVLDAAGLKPDHVQKVNIYLRDMTDFQEMNQVYAKQFNEPYPVRTTVGIADLPQGALIEIELIAAR